MPVRAGLQQTVVRGLLSDPPQRGPSRADKEAKDPCTINASDQGPPSGSLAFVTRPISWLGQQLTALRNWMPRARHAVAAVEPERASAPSGIVTKKPCTAAISAHTIGGALHWVQSVPNEALSMTALRPDLVGASCVATPICRRCCRASKRGVGAKWDPISQENSYENRPSRI